MKYMGSKARFVKEILPIILKDRKPEQWYVEPFAGGMNMICEVEGNRIANDINSELIAMFVALTDGWKPEIISKEKYNEIRVNKQEYKPHIVGWVGFNCSYSGKYFGGFANDYPESRRNKNGTLPNYQREAINNMPKQVEKLKGVVFQNLPYYEMIIPEKSIVYCDPPYEGTTKYKDGFNHLKFWSWVRQISLSGHTVFVSEYKAPSDFKCIWEKEVNSQLSANGKIGGNKLSTERLFLYCP